MWWLGKSLGFVLDLPSAKTILRYTTKKAHQNKLMSFKKKLAATYSPAFAVPSALEGLTSVFGMGTGEPLC